MLSFTFSSVAKFIWNKVDGKICTPGRCSETSCDITVCAWTTETEVCCCYLCAHLSPCYSASTQKTRLRTHFPLKLIESLSQCPTQRMISINVYRIELRQRNGRKLLWATLLFVIVMGKYGATNHFFLFILNFLVKCLFKRQVKIIVSVAKMRALDKPGRQAILRSPAHMQCLTDSKQRIHLKLGWVITSSIYSHSKGLCHRSLGEMTPLFPSHPLLTLLDSSWSDPQMLSP